MTGPDLEFPHVTMCKDADRLENIEATQSGEFWREMLDESQAIDLAAELDSQAVLGSIIKCIAEYRLKNDASQLAVLELASSILSAINKHTDKAIAAYAEKEFFEDSE